jgi:hypothetical protein
MKHTTLLLLLLCTLATTPLSAEETGPAAEKPGSAPVELPGSAVIGNRELPVGLDIVPWRPAAAGQVKEGPTQLLDAPLRPIDPVVFRRELSIYQANKP